MHDSAAYARKLPHQDLPNAENQNSAASLVFHYSKLSCWPEARKKNWTENNGFGTQTEKSCSEYFGAMYSCYSDNGVPDWKLPYMHSRVQKCKAPYLYLISFY
ncbi:unnamed protein product [Pocillopora meandrina]|uniref:Uncharacterized protein n=1 Tax=Pocillopora meandrina TaxID=46732 RepID=A0AAU9VMN8_9CNID|nr:unnamed protein product [Pocillopora meandrina]